MNFTYVISAVIGGLLLVAVMTLNNSIMEESSAVTLDQQSQIYTNSIADVISFDLRKVGYGTKPSTALLSVTQNSIKFVGDLYNNNVIDTVTWKFDKSMPVTTTPNPNDYTLTRTVNNQTTTMNYGVTKFKVILYDSQGNTVTDITLAKMIKIELTCEDSEAMRGNYHPSSWQKLFVPISLN